MPTSSNVRALRFFATLVLLTVIAFGSSGCLTAEHKEVRLSLNPDGKGGHGVITFTNISSEPGDTIDVSHEDFNSLITEYYQGRKVETDNKGMHNLHKKLFRDGNSLMGQIDFDFDDISKVGGYQFKGKGAYMYYTVADGFFTSGQYEASNGTYGGEKMPVIFWDSSERELYFKMALSTPQEVRHSLADMFTNWELKQK